MFGFVSKRKIAKVIRDLQWSQDSRNASDLNDFHWRCGNGNAINYICHKLGIANPCNPGGENCARMDGGEGDG